jgi:hypothetical protein
MKTVSLVAITVVVVAGCLAPAGRLFTTTAEQPDGSSSMPVTLWDQTGLVTAIESASGDPGTGVDRPNVRPDPRDASAVVLTFFTGACDRDTVVSLQRSGTGYELQVAVRGAMILGPCTAQLLIRGLRIRFSQPVAPDSIAAH